MKGTALLWVLLLTCTQPFAGGQLYHWVDETGQSHFSDRRPSDTHVSVEVQPLPRRAPSGRPIPDRYSVVDEARRMEVERALRERARMEERLRRLEEQRLVAELEVARAQARRLAEEPRWYGYPGLLPPPPMHPPAWAGHRPGRSDPRPDHRRGRSLRRPGRSLHPSSAGSVFRTKP